MKLCTCLYVSEDPVCPERGKFCYYFSHCAVSHYILTFALLDDQNN
jgi:hypothetical protein